MSLLAPSQAYSPVWRASAADAAEQNQHFRFDGVLERAVDPLLHLALTEAQVIRLDAHALDPFFERDRHDGVARFVVGGGDLGRRSIHPTSVTRNGG